MLPTSPLPTRRTSSGQSDIEQICNEGRDRLRIAACSDVEQLGTHTRNHNSPIRAA